MRNALKQTFAPPALARLLGPALLTPLAMVTISCSTQPQDKTGSVVPEISLLQFADLKTPSTAWPAGASSTWAMTQGMTTTYVKANFGATGGTAVLSPGNIPLTSGVPVNVTPSATTTYTVTVTDGSGHTVASSATLLVLSVPDATIAGPKAAITNTAGLTASVPAGPATPGPGTTYAWTATNAVITSATNGPTVTFTAGSANNDGTSSTATLTCVVTDPANTPYPVTSKPFSVEVDAVAPTLSYATQAPICYQGLPMQIDLPVVAGAVVNWSVNPALPAGLTLDPALGTIQGTPTSLGTGTYTVTASNSGGSSTSVLTINVQAQPSVVFNAPSPAQILPGGLSTLSWSTGADVTSVTIVGSPADASLPATFPLNGTANVSPSQTTTYTLTANLLSSPEPIQETQTVTLNTTPLAFSPDLSSNTKLTTYGGQATLSWGLAGIPTTLTLTAPPAADVSVLGDTTYNAPVVRRQSFTLKATNTLPSSATSSTVTVAAKGLDTLAGSITQGGGNHDGTGLAAQLNGPSGNVAIDPAGNLYFADSGNHVIRMATPQGVVTTLAGISGVPGGSAVPSDGLHAQFNNPKGVAYWVDTTVTPNQPYLFVCEYGNNDIRKLTLSTSGPVTVTNVTVFAGTLGTTGTTYGNGNTQFNGPEGLVIDSKGNMYVPEYYNEDVAVISNLNAASSTVAGYADFSRNGTAAYADGAVATAGFDHPNAIAIDSKDNLYVTEYTGNRVRLINTATGIVSTLAGDNSKAGGASGFTDATGTAARLNAPGGVAISGNTCFVADTKNNAVRAINLTSLAVTTVIGAKTVSTPGSTNGQGNAALLSSPQGMGFDPSSSLLYIAEGGNNDLRASDLSYNVTNLAGSAPQVGSADSTLAAPYGSMAINPGLSSSNTMAGMVMDASNNLYVADVYNNTIRKITPAGVMTTIAGTPGTAGHADGANGAATFNQPNGLALDGAGNLYVADSGNLLVRMLHFDGTNWNSSTLAGVAGSSGTTDGGLGTSKFKRPVGICVDTAGATLYVTDSTAGTIRKLVNNAGAWTSSTLTFTWTGSGSFYTPMGIALDASGNLYIAERYNYFVAMATPPVAPATSWGATAIGGTSGTKGYNDTPAGGGSSLFLSPQGLCIDPTGVVYVADFGNNVIRKLVGAGGVWTTSTIVGQGVNTVTPPTTTVPLGTSVGVLPATVFAPQAVVVSPAGHDLFITTNGGVAQATAVDGQ